MPSLADRIALRPGSPDLVERLSRLPGSELQSVLMEVFSACGSPGYPRRA